MIELLDCGLLSRHVRKYIRDPIHIYIPFSRLEERIIDSEIFQRLRRIHQLQVAYSVYPGATHNRFTHSVGVMHLAGKFALSLLRTTHVYSGQRAPRVPVDEVEYYVPSYEEIGITDYGTLLSVLIAVRLGGLLHDIGHMPYSHAFDEAIISRSTDIRKVGIRSHEDTGYFIYRNFLKDEIMAYVEREYGDIGVDPSIVVDCLEYIMAPKREARTRGMDVYSIIRHVVKEFVYPADIVDFCMRDSYFTGAVEYGKVDADRLFMFSITMKRIVSGEALPPHIGLMRKAVGALRAFLYSRLWLFNNVYFHKFSRLMDHTVKMLLLRLFDSGLIDFPSIFKGIARGDSEVLEELEKLDDGYILHIALERGDNVLRDLARRILYRRPILKEIFSQEITIQPKDVEYSRRVAMNFETIIQKLRDTISEELGVDTEDIVVDSPPIKFFPLNPYLPYSVFPLVDVDKDRIVGVQEANAWMVTGTRVMDLAVFRVLIRKDALRSTGYGEAEARRRIRMLINEDMEREIKTAFIRKYSTYTYEVTM